MARQSKEEKQASRKQKYEKRMEKIFKEVQQEHHFEDVTDRDGQIHCIVEAAMALQKEICETADHIKVDLAEMVEQDFKINKSDFQEFVNLGYRISHTFLKEKSIQKYNEKLKEKQFSIMLRDSFFASHCVDNTTPTILDPASVDIPEATGFQSEEFDKYLEEGIQCRRKINEELRPAYKKLQIAAEYVSDFKLTGNDFKKIVDFEYYKNGGYPNENSKPKLYAIFERFDDAGRLMQQYHFEQYDKLEQEFGLSVTFNTPDRFKRDFSIPAEKE